MDIERFYYICLQGNVLRALAYLQSFEKNSDEISILEKQYENRFLNGKEIYKIQAEDPWINNVLNCYLEYFRSVLTDTPREEAENNLMLNLSKLVNINNIYNLDEIEEELESTFKEKGYSFLGGITPPYRGPYIWKTTLKKEFNVLLPDNEEKVVVYFISDFLMLSWAHFATFGKHYAGGWAKAEGLYYVDNGDEDIDITSMEFQICFLKHEAQHLSDYKKFPNLNATTLEYRAKLVELIYHPHPYKLIKKFMNESKNDKNLPHPYAAYLIIKELSISIFGQKYIYNKEQWNDLKHEIISSTAKELFLRNNEKLCGLENKNYS